MDDGPAFGITEAIAAIAAMPLDQLEEASGELHRRIGEALRRIGEAHADEAAAPAGSPVSFSRADLEGQSPRHQVAALCALIELGATTLGAVAADGTPPVDRIDRGPAAATALMYAAPNIPALLQRLEQDRRLLTSLARHLEPQLTEVHPTAWGNVRLLDLLVDAAITQPARCGQLLEHRAYAIEEAEIRRLQEEAQRDE